MKNYIVIIAIILLIGFAGNYEATYTRQAKVVAVKGNLITVQDNRGNLWEYTTKDNVAKGDKVILTMYDNHTSIIEDDVIKSVKQQ